MRATGLGPARVLAHFVCIGLYCAEGDVNLLASDELWDPHAIAGLLKSFFRDLPESILTREHHMRFPKIMGASSVILREAPS